MIHPFYQPLISELEAAAKPAREQLGIIAPVIQSIELPGLDAHNVHIQLLRLDMLHEQVSGNKWYKLKYNLAQALLEGADTLITFGGAWSNHLHAFSYIGKVLGLRAVAVLRGQEWQDQSNPLIDDLKEWGTEVHFVSREEYRSRNDIAYQQQWLKKYPKSYLIPEGGDNFWGVLGVSSMFADLSIEDQQQLKSSETVALACGTGNTLVGIRLALSASQRIVGISALKGGWYRAMIEKKLAGYWPLVSTNWDVFSEYHGGGFGKLSPAIKSKMQTFENSTGVLLDPVYTAKLLYGITQKVNEGYFPDGHRLLLIHTGGLQGRRSLLVNS